MKMFSDGMKVNSIHPWDSKIQKRRTQTEEHKGMQGKINVHVLGDKSIISRRQDTISALFTSYSCSMEHLSRKRSLPLHSLSFPFLTVQESVCIEGWLVQSGSQ